MSEAPKKPSTPQEFAHACAEVVINLAEQNYTYNEWGRTLKNVARFVMDDEMQTILRDPSVNRRDIVEMVEDLLKKAEASETEMRFILGLTQNGGLRLMPMISIKYEELSRHAQGIRDVRVVSAEKMTLQEEVKLKRFLKERFNIKAEITKAVDASLIAGFTVSFDGKTLDQSTRGYRERMAKSNRG